MQQDAKTIENLTSGDNKSLRIFLIQAQIQELETKDTLTNDDKKLRYQLKKRLIALEQSETTLNHGLITSEKAETSDLEQTNEELAELNSQLSALRGILLDTPALKSHPRLQTIRAIFAELDNTDPKSEQARKTLTQKLVKAIQAP